MTVGVYGKLPAKRDFVAEAVPRGFLGLFEPWLQGSISASRLALGPAWQKVYFAAPIWRFWLGPALCGRTVLGVMMPSVDGVGRAFPLTLMSAADEAETFPRPELDAQDEFFEPAEQALLDALEPGSSYEDLLSRLSSLPAPRAAPRLAAPDRVTVLSGGWAAVGGERAGATPFAALGEAQTAADAGSGVVWWTIGGERTEPVVVAGRGMPPADQFADFLRGRFDQG